MSYALILDMTKAAKRDDLEIDWTEQPETSVVGAMPRANDLEIDWNVTADDTQAGMPVFTDADVAPDAPDVDVVALNAIAQESASNANVGTIGSIAGGQLRGVGFSAAEGYIDAMRRGVPAATYSSYETTLRTRYDYTTAMIVALNLTGPMQPSVLPVGPGIVHTSTGPSVFDGPRPFVVGPKATEDTSERVEFRAGELIAGAVAGGQHALFAWVGTSGITRGKIVAALESIGRLDWAPEVPNARAQAAAAVEVLSRRGFDVTKNPCTVAGEHHWVVGQVNHQGAVGDNYGAIKLTIKLTGDVLTFDAGGDNASAEIGASVVAVYNARLATEQYKSCHLTKWLVDTLRVTLRAVKLGAMGWLVPHKHVAAAQSLCVAVQKAGFGKGWHLPALPVATCDELRDGIVRGLAEEVSDVLDSLAKDRANAAASKLEHPDRSGDVGNGRIATYLKELRTISARTIAYGQILGEKRVLAVRETIRKAIVELEAIHGDDYSGTAERFRLIWEDIREEQLRDGVL